MMHSAHDPPAPLRGWSIAGRRGGETLPDIPDVDVGDPAALAAAVDAATRALVITLGRAEEEVLPRVSVSQLRALLIISRQAPTNLNQLAEELGAIPSSASRLCDRLVAAGLVTRRPGSVDRREVELRVSAEGRRLVDGLRETRVSELATVLATMSAEGRRALLVGVREFQRAAERLEGSADDAAGPGRDGGPTGGRAADPAADHDVA
jgi:DNA-binding MarR family transcriptional regulator